MRTTFLAGILAVAAATVATAQQPQLGPDLNKAERLEWFRDQGFGLFIHWSMDSQLGTVIGHSMVSASDDYLGRFVNELPKTFNPRKFYPQDWAALAKLAGIKYVMFTAKHHSGFCMWDTETTPFSLRSTPFRRDITGEVVKAFREQGIAPGIYFSPDDFWWLYKNGITIQRGTPEVQPRANPGLLKHDQAQVRELLTKYGPVDLIFFDGEPHGLRDLAWQLQPNIIVTRGAIQTPEQYVPGVPLEGAWEANLTMGTAWGYQPQREVYKSGGDVLNLLIETRAKGGNLLMNVGPKPDGELPIEQEERLREVANWMFVNQESIYAVRPWVITNEKNYWFTKAKNENTVYVLVREPWKRGDWKDIVLKSVRATSSTEASVLGQNDKVFEYRPTVVPKTTFRQDKDGLHLRAFFAQRLQDNSKWPHPVVLKLTNVEPSLTPPRVETVSVRFDKASARATLTGRLHSLGDVNSIEVGFEYRSVKGQDTHERTQPWTPGPSLRLDKSGEFTLPLTGWSPGDEYEVRAFAKHPLLTMYGAEKKITVR